jgi:hypothetical protein
MSEGSVLKNKIKELYGLLCEKEWNPYVTGVIVAFCNDDGLVETMGYCRRYSQLG